MEHNYLTILATLHFIAWNRNSLWTWHFCSRKRFFDSKDNLQVRRNTGIVESWYQNRWPALWSSQLPFFLWRTHHIHRFIWFKLFFTLSCNSWFACEFTWFSCYYLVVSLMVLSHLILSPIYLDLIHLIVYNGVDIHFHPCRLSWQCS